jgi:hypothetical protein
MLLYNVHDYERIRIKMYNEIFEPKYMMKFKNNRFFRSKPCECYKINVGFWRYSFYTLDFYKGFCELAHKDGINPLKISDTLEQCKNETIIGLCPILFMNGIHVLL